MLMVSRTGFYSWQQRPISPREQENELPRSKLRSIRIVPAGYHSAIAHTLVPDS